MKYRVLTIVLIILILLSLSIGASSVNLITLITDYDKSNMIILVSRVPRVLALILSSIGLSIAGIIFQQISRNRFVSPSTASTLDGAEFGLALSFIIFNGVSIYIRSLMAFIFSMITSYIFIKICGKIKYKRGIYIPLIGLMLGYFINSTTIFLSFRFDIIQTISSWFYGDFSKIIKGQYELLYLSIPMFIITYIYLNRFTIVSMGKQFSTNLGLNHNKIVNLGLIIISLLSSIIVIVVGNIPFLGLVIPNIVSKFVGDNMKDKVKLTLFIAPIFIISCDIFGRLIIHPYELPIGLTAGVLGSGIFLYIINRSKNEN